MIGERGGEGRYWAASLYKIVPFLIFYAAPMGALFYLVTPGALTSLLTDLFIQKIIISTIYQAVWSTVLAIALAIPVAYTLSRYEIPGASMIRAVLLTAFFLPAYATAEAFIVMFGRVGALKPIADLLNSIGLSPIYSMEAVIIAHVFYYTPIAVLILEAAFSSINEELYQASQLTGGGVTLTFRRFLFHQLWPALTTTFILLFIFNTLTFTTPLLIGGNFRSIENEIYYNWSKFGGIQKAQSLALFQLGLGLALSLALFYVREVAGRRREFSPGGLAFRRRLSLRPSSAALLAILILTLSFELITIYFALVGGVVTSFAGFVPLGFDVSRISRAFELARSFGIDLQLSLYQTFAVAIFSSIISLFIALAYARSGRESGRVILALAFIAPLATSKASLALGIHTFYGIWLGLFGTWILLAIAHVLAIYPLLTGILQPSFAKVSDDLRQASDVSGASKIFYALRVEFPLVSRSILAALLVGVSSSMSEFTLSTIFSSAGLITMPAAAGRLLSIEVGGVVEAGFALTTVNSIMVMALVLLTFALGGRTIRPVSF